MGATGHTPCCYLFVEEYCFLLGNKPVYQISLMCSSERGTFWHKEVNVNSFCFLLGFSPLLTLIVQSPPVFTEKKRISWAQGRDFLIMIDVAMYTGNIYGESGKELLLPSNEKCFSIIETQTEYSVYVFLIICRDFSLTEAGKPCNSGGILTSFCQCCCGSFVLPTCVQV